MFDEIKKFALDTLFPISCLSCGQDGAWLCEECFEKISLLPFQVCPRCEKLITEKGQLCSFCKKTDPTLSALVAAAKYKDRSEGKSNLSNFIHIFKYNFVEDLSVPLGRLLVKIILKNNLPLPDLIVPVPLHKRRLRWRGFNQSELLANYVGQNLTPGFPIPVFPDLIRRKKYTAPQMKIGKYAERRKNIQEMFEINKKFYNREYPGDFLRNKKILLIDDICTTGATIFECAKVLKQNGAKKVFAAVIARQEF